LYVSLEKLGVAIDLLKGARLVTEKTETVKGAWPAFLAEWERASERLTNFDREARQRNWKAARPAVPTMFLFDRAGKTVHVLYGAPPDLHEQVGKYLDDLMK
jgi:hypothetical protein